MLDRNQNRRSELGTWAGTQAQQYWKMKNRKSQDQAKWHDLEILDF